MHDRVMAELTVKYRVSNVNAEQLRFIQNAAHCSAYKRFDKLGSLWTT